MSSLVLLDLSKVQNWYEISLMQIEMMEASYLDSQDSRNDQGITSRILHESSEHQREHSLALSDSQSVRQQYISQVDTIHELIL